MPLQLPGDPDVAKMHRTVAAKIAKSEALDAPASAAPGDSNPDAAPTDAAPAPTPTPTPGARKKRRAEQASSSATPKPGQDTDDLAEVCSAR